MGLRGDIFESGFVLRLGFDCSVACDLVVQAGLGWNEGFSFCGVWDTRIWEDVCVKTWKSLMLEVGLVFGLLVDSPVL